MRIGIIAGSGLEDGLKRVEHERNELDMTKTNQGVSQDGEL